MFVLTRSITILDRHTRLARLETDASLLAALGAALGIVTIIHFSIIPTERRRTGAEYGECVWER
jgi:hypothetical protein